MFWTIVIVVFAGVLAVGWWVGRGRPSGSFHNNPVMGPLPTRSSSP